MCDVARSRGSRASESTSGVEREPGEVHASRSAAAGELVDEGAQAEVACRLPGIDWQVAMPPTLVLLHGFTQTRQSWRRTVAALGGTLSRARARPPGPRPGGQRPAELRPACDRVRPGARAGDVHARRLLDGRPDRAARARSRARAGRAAGARRREPGHRGRRASARRAGAPTTRSPTGSRRSAIEAFAREWGGAAAVRRPAGARRGRRARRPAAQHAARPRRRAARARHRRDGAAVGPAGRARRCR